MTIDVGTHRLKYWIIPSIHPMKHSAHKARHASTAVRSVVSVTRKSILYKYENIR
jgi:hypothetical protein